MHRRFRVELELDSIPTRTQLQQTHEAAVLWRSESRCHIFMNRKALWCTWYPILRPLLFLGAVSREESPGGQLTSLQRNSACRPYPQASDLQTLTVVLPSAWEHRSIPSPSLVPLYDQLGGWDSGFMKPRRANRDAGFSLHLSDQLAPHWRWRSQRSSGGRNCPRTQEVTRVTRDQRRGVRLGRGLGV